MITGFFYCCFIKVPIRESFPHESTLACRTQILVMFITFINHTEDMSNEHFLYGFQIIVGNFGLSYDQERVQMGMWCMFAAPLLLSNDLRNIRDSSKALIQNKRLLAINQDRLGKAGTYKFQRVLYYFPFISNILKKKTQKTKLKLNILYMEVNRIIFITFT